MRKLLLLITFGAFICSHIMAQVNVSGKVTDSNGETIPGANVSIKGTTLGTVTDMKGEYALGNVPADATIVFSFLGMLTEEVKVEGRTEITVALIDDYQSLEEVVVVGYGSVKRANLAGAVTDISAKELQDIPVANLSAALEAKMPGVRINLPSGNPLSNTTIQIRANTTFSDIGESPIYVIDGIVRDKEAFDLLDPNEVESISVLKDASAAVYGATSAGGVILVKTKKGRIGKVRVNYSGSYGVSQVINTTEMLSAYEHAKMLNNGFEIQQLKPKDPQWYSEDELAYYKDSLSNGGYNWLEGAWKNATVSKHNLNFTGGTESIKYFFGGNYLKETGSIDNLYVSKYSLRSSVEAEIIKGMTASFEASFGQKESNTPLSPFDSQGDLMNETFRALLENPKWIPPLINGKVVYQDKAINNNPYAMWENDNYKHNTSGTFNYIAGLNYKLPIKGLSMSFQFSQSKNNSQGKTYNGISYGYNFQQKDGFHIFDLNAPLDSVKPKIELQGQEYLEESTDLGRSYQGNGKISYNRTFGLHNLNVMTVVEFGEGYGSKVGWKKSTDQIIEGYDLEWAFDRENTGYSIHLPAYSQSAKLSYIGRLNYIYADRYISEFAFRYESNLTFPESHRWGFFPSVLLGWVITEEPFFGNAKNIVSFLKLRASAGRLGNVTSQPFTYQLVYSPSSNHYMFGDKEAFTVNAKNDAFINPDLEWQKSDSYNLGVDIRFLDNKLYYTVDGFYKYTFDILEPISSRAPTTVGIAHNNKVKFNYGAMHGYGYEMDLGYKEQILGGFKYDIRFIFSWSEAMILRKAQALNVLGTWRDETKNPVDNQPGYISSGIITTQDEVDDILMDNPNYSNGGGTLEPGMLNYLDLRGTDGSEGPNGRFSGSLTEDRTIISRRTSPPYTYGSTLGLEWKGFRLNMTFSGLYGHMVFYDKESMVNPTAKTNVPAFWADHWTPENPDAAYPRAYNYVGEGNYSTFWRRDGHTLRVSDLNISYSLPSRWLKTIGLNSFRIYMNSKYLWTLINPFEYKDANLSRYNGYPMTRNYVFGLNFGF